MKYLIIGEPRAGKTEFGNALAQALGCAAMDTSTPLIERLAKLKTACMVNTFGLDLWVEQIRQMKDFYRGELITLGNMLCDLCPSVLIDECAAKADVIIGPRRKAEVDAWMSKQGSEVVLIKIIRPGTRADNFDLHDIERHYPTLIIDSDGSQDLLARKARSAVSAQSLIRPFHKHGIDFTEISKERSFVPAYRNR